MKFKRALITGGAGFIGSHIVDALLKEGVEPVVLDDLSMGRRENIPSGVRFIEADILDEGKIKCALERVDIVFHEAARVSIRNSGTQFYEDAKVNIMGTLNLLKGLGKSRVKKLIYASSMAVYGEAEKLLISEQHPLRPASPYGISKLTAEKYCLELGKAMNIDVVALRYFNTYGIRQTFTPYVGVITIFINRLLEGRSPIIFGDGEQVRDFVSVKDVARANILAMKANCSNEIFNIGTGKGTTVNQIADLLIQCFGDRVTKEYAPRQLGEPGSSIADISKIQKDMGFKPNGVLMNELPFVIKWIKQNRERDADKQSIVIA